MRKKPFTVIDFREDEMILTDLTKSQALKILAETYVPKKLPFVKNTSSQNETLVNFDRKRKKKLL